MTAASRQRHGASVDAVLRTHDLAVGYGQRQLRRVVLEHVNLTVEPGELVCLLGPNGIGKSTLLRTMARMQPALRGRVEIGGADVRALSHTELARRVGVVLTERVAVGALTARQVIGLGRYPHSGWFGRFSDRDRGVVEWAIDAVGARPLAACDCSRLSDGERQRVMIARALAQEPVLLALDEPTAFLDVPSRVELMGLLRRLTRDRHLAVVVATHELELALRTADVIWLVMPGGELLIGAPEDLVMSGGIGQAFEGRRLRFQPEQRSLRVLTGGAGDAAVHGCGLRAALAAAVLEREGFAVVGSSAAAPALSVHAHDTGWRLWTDEGECSGADFGSLAKHLRGRRTGS